MGGSNKEEYVNGHENNGENGYMDYLLDDEFDQNDEWNEDSGEMDLKNIDQDIFLVKVPDYVYNEIFNEQEEGKEVAYLRKYNQLIKTEDAVITDQMVHLPEHFKSIPRDYTLETTDANVQKTYIFEAYENEVANRVTGKVVKECIMKPISTDPAYRNILRQRTIEQREKEETNEPDDFEKSDSLESPRPYTLQYLLPSSGFKKRARVDFENKVFRMPDNELRQLLFMCFKKYAYWSFKGLKNKINQPEAHIRNILNEIADLNRRGKHRALYELKPHYKQHGNFQNADENPSHNPFNQTKMNYDGHNVIEVEDEEDEFEKVD